MLSLLSSQNEPSALLSNARTTIATLIQRPSSVTTSNAFDEFAILDNLIDVSHDVDLLDGGESRKFLNIAQLITASTCIYSRRVDALYKLINTFQSGSSPSSQNKQEENEQSESIIINEQEEEEEEKSIKKCVQEKKKKMKDNNRSFICHDSTKISLSSTKNFFLDRTSLFDLKLFQKYVPIENKQFWIDDNRPIIFDLLFDKQQLETIDEQDDHQLPEPDRLIDVLNRLSPVTHIPTSFDDDDDIPLPITTYDDQESSCHNESINALEKLIEKKKMNRQRTKKTPNDIDLNIFRTGLTDEQQALFRFHKMKSISTKIKIEQIQFSIKTFNRKHFDALIKDCPQSTVSLFIYPTIIIHHLTIRERYSTKIDRPFSRMIRSPPIPISDVLDENALVPLSSPVSSFIYENNDDIQEDADIRMQTDMEQFLDAAIHHSNEEQVQSKVFLTLRSSIISYMNEHESVQMTNFDDLLESLDDNYSLPLVFSQLLHLCASTQRYSLHSTSNDKLFIEKIM